MQPVPVAPAVVMNQGGNRQQVPLRDYLNSRIAPFLKKAMTQSLEVEAEYPLQWLGECLINQSMLYEGNPDETNIRQHFKYSFVEPTAQPEPQLNGATSAAADTSMQAEEPVPETSTPNGVEVVKTAQEDSILPTLPQETEGQAQTQTETPAAPQDDTVMGGTS